jgi:hypothetical protein
MARVSGLTTGLTIRYLKQGDSLNGDSIVNNFDGGLRRIAPTSRRTRPGGRREMG